MDDAVSFIKRTKHGYIFSISVKTCRNAKTCLKYLPSKDNPYHSEIHGNENEIELSDEQALELSRRAVMVSEP